MAILNEAGQKLFLGDYSWDELDRHPHRDRLVFLLPFGSVEEHGYHLPLKCDYFLASRIAELAARRVPEVIVMPAVSYGSCIHAANYCGTINVRSETIIALVCDIVESLYRHGFRKLLIYNGHGGNNGVLDAAQREAIYRLVPPGRPVGTDFRLLVANTVQGIPVETLNELAGGKEWGHACQLETSAMLVLEPEAVDMSRAVDQYLPGDPETIWITRDTKPVNPSGVHGTPSVSNAAAGEKLVGLMVRHLEQLLRKL